MKPEVTFNKLLAQVERHARGRKDFYAPSNELRLDSQQGSSNLSTPEGNFLVLDSAHYHLADWGKINYRYYNRLRQQEPQLLDANVNTWLQRGGSRRRLVRTHTDNCRAVVSSRYATLDNDRLLRELAPIVEELRVTVEEYNLTDERMTVKLTSGKLQGEVRRGDVVQLGLVVRNSEVREAALSVQPFLLRLVCTNGLIMPTDPGQGEVRRHLGPDWGRDGDGYGLVPRSRERVAWEKALWQGLGTAVRASLQAEAFSGMLEKLTATTRLKTTLEPAVVVQQLGRRFGLSAPLQAAVTGHLAEGYSGTLWDVVNAVTRTARDIGSDDTATRLQELGGRLSSFNPKQWEALTSLN